MKSIADVIDNAINYYLWDGRAMYESLQIYEFSCPAIGAALRHREIKTNKAKTFIKTLGCGDNNRHLFDEFPEGEKRQYARALWLTFAAMIAREEKV